MGLKIKRKNQVIRPKTFTYTPTIPDDFILMVDSREQEQGRSAYVYEDVRYIRKGLQVGDYSMLGFETKIAIERKAQEDFYVSICDKQANGQSRMVNQVARLKKLDFAGMVIECSLEELLNPVTGFSSIHPNSVYGNLVSLVIRHGVHVFCGTREQCRLMVLSWLVKYYQVAREV